MRQLAPDGAPWRQHSRNFGQRDALPGHYRETHGRSAAEDTLDRQVAKGRVPSGRVQEAQAANTRVVRNRSHPALSPVSLPLLLFFLPPFSTYGGVYVYSCYVLSVSYTFHTVASDTLMAHAKRPEVVPGTPITDGWCYYRLFFTFFLNNTYLSVCFQILFFCSTQQQVKIALD